jgi:tetratricopeptide (TPR) repeat protein
MKRLKLFFIICLIVSFNISCHKNNINAEERNNINYKEKYDKLFKENRYDVLYDHIQTWETEESNNPEIYIAYFNYYIFRNRFSGVSIDREIKGSVISIAISDPETGEVVGYNNDAIEYDSDDIITAVEFLDKGLNIAPDRLDMHFGKIRILNEIELYNEAGSELYTTLEISKKINDKWLWANSEQIENGKMFLLNNINDYYRFWLSKRTEESLNQIKKCTEKQIELYPDIIYSYNYLAIFYSIKDQLQETLKYFLLAEKVNPNDTIVLLNIARTYFNINNKEKAREYYLRVLDIGNEQDKEQARFYINQL